MTDSQKMNGHPLRSAQELRSLLRTHLLAPSSTPGESDSPTQDHQASLSTLVILAPQEEGPAMEQALSLLRSMLPSAKMGLFGPGEHLGDGTPSHESPAARGSSRNSDPALQRLRKQNRELRKERSDLLTIGTIARTISSTLLIEEILERILQGIRQVLGVERILLGLVNQKTGEEEMKLALGLPAQEIQEWRWKMCKRRLRSEAVKRAVEK